MINIENIPKINLSKLTEAKIANIEDGVKIYDLETSKVYEKRDGSFQEMIEEEEPEIKETEKDHISQCTKEDIIKIVESGNKLLEVNTFMRFKTAKHELLAQKDAVNQKVNFMFKCTPDQINIIQSRVGEVTKEAIEKATFDELKEFFVIDGKDIELNLKEILEQSDIEKAYRDFLLYLKEIDDIVKEIDTQIREIDDLCTNFSSEVLEKSKNIYEWDEYIYTVFKDKLNDPSLSESEKERLKRIIDTRQDALTLAPIYKVIKEEIDLGRRKSLIYAFQNRFKDTIKKAEKYAMENNFCIYFQLFDGVEQKAGYDKYKNLIAYLFARYIKYNNEKFSKIDNAFIGQVIQNLIMLNKDQMKEPSKSIFIKSIKNLIDLVANE